MKTIKLSGARAADIARAGEILRGGGVAAIPTETVYGLAANALDEGAVAKIFAAKGRPADNPLIVHISDVAQLDALCRDLPQSAYALARAFWPGPLTLVLKKAPRVPDAVTASLDTVAVRMPAHKAALAVIAAAGVPLAAPSANISGRPSPTSAAHVLNDMCGKIDAVLDGGPCRVGVESTVLDLTCRPPVILRPGAVTREEIAAVTGEVDVFSSHSQAEAPRSPGLKYTHYATRAPLTLFSGAPEDSARAILARTDARPAVLCFDEYLPEMKERLGSRVYSLGASWQAEKHARRLFGLLRRIDGTRAQSVLVQSPRAAGRAAATVNRLARASGGQIVSCTGRPVIGVTGASGSGKSTLARAFADLGAAVFDADAIYKRLLRQSAHMRAAIAQRFPLAVIDDQIDLPALGKIVFSDALELAALNALTHPYVALELRTLVNAERERACVLDVPVLFGSGIDLMCTCTVGVLAARETMLERISSRDAIDLQSARARLDAQKDDAFFRGHCDIIVENISGKRALTQQAERILREQSV